MERRGERFARGGAVVVEVDIRASTQVILG